MDMKRSSRQGRLVAVTVGAIGLYVFTAGTALAQDACKDLPSHDQLKIALTDARNANNGGFNLDMWGTIVNRDGIVCAVAFTGDDRGDQWPGSRAISAQKANTANSFSLPGLALSTANLYTAVQPGGSLFGLQESNPINTDVAYGGNPKRYGQSNDPMVGGRIGGVNVFGGGLALYNGSGTLIGAVGVSGDTSCADHFIAWRTRKGLNLDKVPRTDIVTGDEDRPDNIVFAAGAWQHPHCLNAATEDNIADNLPAVP
jgi:uncharacterized protein GlcG (DUF336 family)